MTKTGKMKLNLIAAICIITVVMGQEPMLCQKRKGMRIYKKRDHDACPTTEGAHLTTAEILVPKVQQRDAPAKWVGIYEAICETHYFFWGSYTRNAWTHTVYANDQQLNTILKGSCPSETHPTPLIERPKPQCVYTWPNEKTMTITYCIEKNTVIVQKHGQSLHAEEEALQKSAWEDGHARTVSGAVVIWTPVKNRTNTYERKFLGSVYKKDKAVIVPLTEELFVLSREIEQTQSTQTYETIEGFRIILENTKVKREADHSFQDLQRSLHSEITGKINYVKNELESASKKVSNLCDAQKGINAFLSMMTGDMADIYVRTLLEDYYITAALTQNYILIWPCKKMNTWWPRQEYIANFCSTLLPIWYEFTGRNHTGYLNLNTMQIQNKTDLVDCNNVHPRAYDYHGAVYLWNGENITSVNVPEVTPSIPRAYSSTGKDLFVPRWEDRWLYSDSDFLFTEHHYMTQRDIEVEMSEENEKDHALDEKIYGSELRIPFLSLRIWPSVICLFHYAGYVGGLLYLWSVVRRYMPTRSKGVPAQGVTHPYVEYRKAKQNREI